MTETAFETPVEEVPEPTPSKGVFGDDYAEDKRHHAGEKGPVVLAGSWVVLADTSEVPSGFAGHIAAVMESPWKPAPIGAKQTLNGYVYEQGGKFIVQTRDEANMTLEVSMSSFQQVAASRSALENRG